MMVRRRTRSRRTSGWIDELFGNQPLLRRLLIRADEEDFLHRAGAGVEAFQASVGGILDFEIGGGVASAAVDSAGDDSRDVGAVLDDVVEEGVEPTDAAVLAFDSAELHWWIVNRQWLMVNCHRVVEPIGAA